MQTDSTTKYDLIDAETNELIGPATPEQIEASLDADERGEAGIVQIDADGHVMHCGCVEQAYRRPFRTVYVREAPMS